MVNGDLELRSPIGLWRKLSVNGEERVEDRPGKPPVCERIDRYALIRHDDEPEGHLVIELRGFMILTA